jgi:peptidylprolyl isomerase
MMGAVALLALGASYGGAATPAPKWRPVPVVGAAEPADVIKNAPASAWRDIDPENLLIMDLKNGARIVIELAPAFAPVHVANIRTFARAKWWNNAAIYRVQDNYVVQWGINDDDEKTPFPAGIVKVPPAEYDRDLAGLAVRPLGYPDAYAPMVGHTDGWPVGYNPESGRAWLTHCYASVGVARSLAPDTGSGSELYTVSGHAPRQLDRNIATIGRILEGMERLTPFPRGKAALGFIEDKADQVSIASIRLASDIPVAERPTYEVMRTDSDSFAAYVLGRANRSSAFFERPTGGVDLCNAPVPVRRKGG